LGGVRFASPAADGRLTICSEPMDEDTTGEETAPKRNGDLSEYKLDTYDEDDEGPASSASGHAVFGITAICLPSSWSFHQHKRVTVLP
jgi:hypothetical protein